MGDDDRPGTSGLPGMPARIPIEPRVSTIVLGVVLLAAGGWMAFSWLPDHRPLQPRDFADVSARGVVNLVQERLEPKPYRLLWAATMVVLVMGLAALLSGLTWRNYAEVVCRRCNRRVVARRYPATFRCPVGEYDHVARVRWSIVFSPLVVVAAWIAFSFLAAAGP